VIIKKIIGGSKWLLFVLALSLLATTSALADVDNRGAWGDQGDGTFKNPVLLGDFLTPM
jgi:hypothetical protein